MFCIAFVAQWAARLAVNEKVLSSSLSESLCFLESKGPWKRSDGAVEPVFLRLQ